MLITQTLPAQETKVIPDSSAIAVDSTKKDSVKVKTVKVSKQLKSKVEYVARDSIRFDIIDQKVYLYGKAEINYEDINLKADYIEILFRTSIVFAKGWPDSTGKVKGNPVFKQGSETFDAKSITYNFETKKGIIKEIYTAQNEGYLHGVTVKRDSNNTISILNGSFTTCNHKHPHYEIHFQEAKVFPGDKIVTGPAILTVEDVSTPIIVPFGYFPNKKGRKSGILMPQYGEEERRGFFFANGGYYFGINDYMDMELRGDIYTHGSWAIKPTINYNKRYKFRGSMNFNYAQNVFSDKGLPDYSLSKAFLFKWNHEQDAKARPNSRFAANVNAGSSNFNSQNSENPNDFLNNTLQSNVSYSKTFGTMFNFSANASHSQNTYLKTVTVRLPEIVFSANRFQPFKRKETIGKPKWYENIGASYNLNARNEINTYDSLIFKESSLKRFQNGINHSIPISTSFKILKYFNLTPSFNYNERWYFQTIRKRWDKSLFNENKDTLYTDTINGFKAAHDFNISTSLTTKLYGMLRFKRGKVEALRHVLTPQASFIYRPDFGTPNWGYYKNVQTDTLGKISKYSIFEKGIYGGPPQDKSGLVNLSFANNLEMKVRTPRDSLNPSKKIVLIESFSVGTSYDLAKDSLKWSKVGLSGRTKLFKNLDVTYASYWDPYIVNKNNFNLNQYEWNVNNRPFRFTNSDWNFSLNWNLNSQTFLKKKTTGKIDTAKKKSFMPNLDGYADFKIPWSLNVYYTLRYTHQTTAIKVLKDTIQTLSASGEVNITPNWKIGFTTGYDFTNKAFSYSSIDIYRDLHCWEMKFHWIPYGPRKSYLFSLGIKAQMLQDLKLTKKRDWHDF